MSVDATSYDKGVIVTSLARGGPGQRAGLTANDIIDQVGPTPITSPDQLADELGSAAGHTVEIGVRRHGIAHKVRLSLPRSGRPHAHSWVESR